MNQSVDDSSEAIGQLGEELAAVRWSQLDDPVCRGCEFLLSCLGGCLRNQMKMARYKRKKTASLLSSSKSRCEYICTGALMTRRDALGCSSSKSDMLRHRPR
jgi:sulfatase maturation enzyme AslB (radical SAM superfamily)